MVDARRKLVLLRHAKAAAPDDVADFERPLAKRGTLDAPAAGRWLRDNVPAIEVVACSPATRARRTWELAAPEIPAAPDVRYDERIYAATAHQLLDVVRALPGPVMTAVLVGHNPGLEDLVRLLTGQRAELKTAGIAVLSTAATWSEAGESWAEADDFAKPRG
ncbi:SixA phosphatase family protein [Saccharopolyspora rosea]|uniref:SixA phosphatase family protein n=1 Tax=Saccharopolyspora rosea TaxID=524884 RepID=A0ABW3G0Y2_9PSEU|nr:histidine phosphatase family protein [Saccharopolyspora rosea]